MEPPAAKTQETAPEPDTSGMRTETKAALDTDLQRAAAFAAKTGRLALENLDQPVFTNDIAASTDNFHRAASVRDWVEMSYPMVHIAPGWAPLDHARPSDPSGIPCQQRTSSLALSGAPKTSQRDERIDVSEGDAERRWGAGTKAPRLLIQQTLALGAVWLSTRPLQYHHATAPSQRRS